MQSQNVMKVEHASVNTLKENGATSLIDGIEIVYSIDDMVNVMAKMQDTAYRKNMGECAREWALNHCNRNEKVEWLDRKIRSLLER